MEFITKWFGVWTKSWWLCLYNTIRSWFVTYYRVTISFDKEYGDDDDKVYISDKIIKNTDKWLKFRNKEGLLVEFRSSSGLHFIIEELE